MNVPVAESMAAGRRAVVSGLRYWNRAWVWAVALFVLLVARTSEFLPFVSRIRPVALACAVAMWVHSSRSPAGTWRAATRHPQFVRFAAYLGLAIFTVPFAIWPGNSFALVLVVTYGLVLLTAFLLTPPDLRTFDRVTKGMVLGAGVSAVVTLVAGAVLEGSRLTGTGSYDPNDLAAFCDIMFFIALGCGMRERGLRRIVLLAIAVLFVAVTMKTASRGGAIALAVGGVVFLLGLGARRFFVALAFVVCAAPVAWRVAPETFRARITTIDTISDDYNATSTAGRSYIWKRGLVFFAHRPIIGIGAGNFETRLGQDFAEQGVVGAWHTAHNTVIQVFVEMGIIGGILLLTMIGSSLASAFQFWRPRRRGQSKDLARVGLHRPELLAAFTAYATAAFFLSHAFSYITYGVIAFGAYIGRVRREADLAG